MSSLLGIFCFVILVVVVVVVGLLGVLVGGVVLVGGGVLLWMLLGRTDVPALEGEILREVLANHFKGIEGRGGRLTITNHEISFRPHLFNVQRSPVWVPLSDIVSVDRCDTLGLVSNGMLVRTKGGRDHQFVVRDREDLIPLLTSMLSCPDPSRAEPSETSGRAVGTTPGAG